MQEESFRLNSNDPNSRSKLDGLLREVGVYLPEFLSENFSHLIDNLFWRKTTSTSEDNGGTTLQVFLDLGEGDEVLLATIRAGEISTFSHASSYPH